MAQKKKPVKVDGHKRSKPSKERKNPGAPKPGPKTVVVGPHKRSKPSK